MEVRESWGGCKRCRVLARSSARKRRWGLAGVWLVRGADGRERAGIRWVAGGLRSDLVGVTSVCGYRGGVSKCVGACEVGSSGTEEAWGGKLILPALARLPVLVLFPFAFPL